jgi:hypothetical protein
MTFPYFSYTNSVDPQGTSRVVYTNTAPDITWTTGDVMTWTTGDPIEWIGSFAVSPELDNTASMPTISYKGEA